MHWKTKSKIQNVVALIPSSVSYAAYYWMQRRFGGLRQINPESKLQAAVTTWKLILDVGHDPLGKVFYEVGTGRVPNVPMSFWLMGAGGTITVDVNPYVKGELVTEVLQYLKRHEEKIREIFGDLLDEQRFADLISLGANVSLDAFLDTCQITYVSQGDAADSGLASDSVDFHTSRTVFEHIPLDVLRSIILEGNRIVRDDGLFVHRIDYSDHFSHSDRSISSINFLQYSDAEWARIAGNRYMYMNRLRHDDFLALYETLDQQVLLTRPDVDPRAQELLRNGALQIDERFQRKSPDILAMSGSWIVSQVNQRR